MSRNWFDRRVLPVLHFLLGGVFVYAGLAKFGNPQQFADSIASFQALPEELVNLWALALPPFEVLAGLMVITGWRRRVASLAIALVTLMFAVAFAQGMLRGLPLDCGCFGAGMPGSDAGAALGRDVLLMMAAVGVYRGQVRRAAAR